MTGSTAVAAGKSLLLSLVGCADADNPAALSQLDAQTQFDIAVGTPETFEEVQIHVDVLSGGEPVIMRQAEMEIELDPAPVLEGGTAHVHLLAFALLQGDTVGPPAAGLTITAAVHGPDGRESPLPVTEEGAGRYEGEYAFDGAGLYELHVGIEGAEGEFHIPVLAPGDNGGTGNDDQGGHGHGH